MNLIIRFATAADSSLIADLSRQTFYETFARQNTAENMEKFMSEQFSKERLMAEVGAPGNIFLLAFAGDVPVGYVKMREGEQKVEFGNKTSIEIARIYAASSSIGKGVGSALMQRCIEIARGMNKEIIWLGVWEKNQQAIAFYQKWGFEQFGTHVFKLGNDPQTDWLMKKEF
ncbi:MAG: GNAT family N-acetyltransferase [Bacteroidota bacterium]